jgi:hypothetical protein
MFRTKFFKLEIISYFVNLLFDIRFAYVLFDDCFVNFISTVNLGYKDTAGTSMLVSL